MKTLLPKTIEEWNAKKRMFMRLLTKEQPWTYMAFVYRRAVNYCDKKIAKAALIVLACLILSIGGCGTFDGLSKLADGVRSDVHHITQPVDKEK